jgi:hypothetical protein
MNVNSLRAVVQLASGSGVKCILYGGPGSGKTPLIKTCPRPVGLFTEHGLLSLRGCDTVPGFMANSTKDIDDFFAWFSRSNERRNFDTLFVDSGSQMAEMYLLQELANNKHGLKAYGNMSDAVMKHLGQPGINGQMPTGVYYMHDIHVVLVCKQSVRDEGGGLMKKRPFFPGNDLNVRVPHLFDGIFWAGKEQVPGAGEQRVIRTAETLNIAARDRSGKLDPIERPDMGNIFSKCMS